MIMDLSHKMEVRAFTLAHPYRVVIDMPQVTFQLPAGAGETGRGLIKAYRFGLVMQGGSRMVIDLARPARVDKAFVLDAANDQPARLVLDLSGTDRESFLRTVALENRASGTRKAEPHPEQKPNGDSAAAGGDRSRPWRHRQRHQGGERRVGKDHRPRVLADAARQDREGRQVPRRHDPHRRYLRGARRPRPARALAPSRAVRSRFMPTRCGAATATPMAPRSTRSRSVPRMPLQRAWPKPRTRPTPLPASISPPSPRTSPAS